MIVKDAYPITAGAYYTEGLGQAFMTLEFGVVSNHLVPLGHTW